MNLDNLPDEYSIFSKVLDEHLGNALMDYEDAAEKTVTGKYRCRECGMLFDTLEEHDLHHRIIHERTQPVPLTGMPL